MNLKPFLVSPYFQAAPAGGDPRPRLHQGLRPARRSGHPYLQGPGCAHQRGGGARGRGILQQPGRVRPGEL